MGRRVTKGELRRWEQRTWGRRQGVHDSKLDSELNDSRGRRVALESHRDRRLEGGGEGEGRQSGSHEGGGSSDSDKKEGDTKEGKEGESKDGGRKEGVQDEGTKEGGGKEERRKDVGTVEQIHVGEHHYWKYAVLILVCTLNGCVGTRRDCEVELKTRCLMESTCLTVQ